MKLRFYLRGLGIGIAVTAVFMSLSGTRTQALSDEQIIARAKTLGMVQEDKVLFHADKKEQEEPEAEEPAQEVPKDTEPEAEIPEAEISVTAEQAEASAGNTDNTADDKTDNKTDSPFVLEIASGSSSDTVSALLQKGGLIQNAAEFDDYLCDNHYDNRIVAGRHTIPAGADYETIAKIIVTAQPSD